MALSFHYLPETTQSMWYISPERYYLSREGEVVTEGDPRAASLLVGKGCRLAIADAQKYGLLKAHAAPPAVKARRSPPATK